MAILSLFALLVIAGVAALALAAGDDEIGDGGTSSAGVTDPAPDTTDPPPTTAPGGSTGSTNAPETTQPPPTEAPTTSTAPSTTAPPGDEEREGDDDTPEGIRVGQPIEVTGFGTTLRLPNDWRVGGTRESKSLRTFLASGPSGASVRVDEDRTWPGGWEDLEPDARRLEADLASRYEDMETLAMEHGRVRGARTLRWEFVYTSGDTTLRKIDLFFQTSPNTPPAAVLVSWPAGSERAELEARAVLETVKF